MNLTLSSSIYKIRFIKSSNCAKHTFKFLSKIRRLTNAIDGFQKPLLLVKNPICTIGKGWCLVTNKQCLNVSELYNIYILTFPIIDVLTSIIIVLY